MHARPVTLTWKYTKKGEEGETVGDGGERQLESRQKRRCTVGAYQQEVEFRTNAHCSPTLLLLFF